MSSFNDSPDADSRSHSPFIGILAVLAALITANLFQTFNLFSQRSNLKQMDQRADTLLPEARVLQGQLEPRLEALSRDLVLMAPTNEAARTLVSQFGITWNPNNAATGTTNSTSPAAGARDSKAR